MSSVTELNWKERTFDHTLPFVDVSLTNEQLGFLLTEGFLVEHSYEKGFKHFHLCRTSASGVTCFINVKHDNTIVCDLHDSDDSIFRRESFASFNRSFTQGNFYDLYNQMMEFIKENI